MDDRPPPPPFSRESAPQKVQAAEDACDVGERRIFGPRPADERGREVPLHTVQPEFPAAATGAVEAPAPTVQLPLTGGRRQALVTSCARW